MKKNRKVIIDQEDILKFRGLAENVSRAQESLIKNSETLTRVRTEIENLEKRVEELREVEKEFYKAVQEKYSFETLEETQNAFLQNLS